MKRFFAIASVLGIITGFGLTHASSGGVELIGIGLLSLGCLYLLYLLLSTKSSKNNP